MSGKQHGEVQAHDPVRAEEAAKPASPRSFAFLVAAIALAYALLPLTRHQSPIGWAVGTAAVLLLIGWLAPALFSGPTRLWLAFGGVLSRIAAPVSMFVVFFGVISSYGALLRLLGRDVLTLKRDAGAPSYWCDRRNDPPIQFNRQF